MNSSYEYDENNQTWPIFALALSTVVVVPCTVYAIHTALSSDDDNASTSTTTIKQKNIPVEVAQFRQQKKNKGGSLFSSKLSLFLLAGWTVIALLVYTIMTTETITVGQAFDPYELLGVEFGSSEKVVKSVYKKLSIKFHPDKIRNKSEEEMKLLEEKFVLITKAYKALTDETTKENYEKYGNPDGPQLATHGIALPKWLIEGATSPIVMLVYIFLIGFFLPYIVKQWWTKSKSITKKGIRTETASMFVEQLLNQKNAEIIRLSTIMKYLSQAVEYEELLPNHSPEDIVELYTQYLNREFTQDNLLAVSIINTLISGLVDIASSFRNLDISLAAVSALKHFSQALPENPKNDLLQLPHVDPSSVAKSNVIRLGKLFTLPKPQIKEILGIQDDAKLEESLQVGSQIPRLEIIKAEFKVPGETVVPPESQAYISLKVLVKSPKHHGATKLDSSKLEEEETMESLREPFKVVFAQPQLPITHAPYFPELRQSGYIVFVVLQKDGKICEQPVIIKNLDLSNLSLTEEEFKDGELVKVGTFKIPMSQPAPKELGKVQFRVIVKSLDYFTNDIDVPLVMTVQDLPKIEEVDYEIPVLKADTLAGAMAGLRGEEVRGIDDDEDDESDFEEEEDFTDIDSDTDVEEEEEKKK